MRKTALALLGTMLAGAAVAHGDEIGLTPIRLSYERRTGAESCPDEEQLREAITTRLGSDPFNEQAKRTLEISVSTNGDGLEARIGLIGADGVTRGQRDLISKSRECRDLSTVLVLTAAMALDPLAARASEGPTGPMPSSVVLAGNPAPASEAEAVASTAPPARGPTPSGVEASLAFVGEAGALSGPSIGLTLGVGYEWSFLSLSLEAQGFLPVHEQLISETPGVASGSVSSSQITGTLVPCLTRWHLGICGLVSGGVTRVTASGIVPPGTRALPYFALGARVYGGLPLWDWLETRVLLDVQAPLTQTSIVLDTTTTWTAAPVSGEAALALVAHFR
jgi:hypothetical protein